MSRSLTAILIVLAASASFAQGTDDASASGQLADIDAFMEKVLDQRDTNWDDFYNYFCKEGAELRIEGSIVGVPIQGFEREYLWSVIDGYLVRSPLSVDGVAVPADERKRAEEKWIERLKKREKERGADRDTFMGFEFEPGNYLYAGSRTFEGRDVVVIEYYPEKMFSADEDDEDDNEDEETDPRDEELEAALNKVFLVTLLIDPEEHQIVKMTLDNYGFDFLPARWLVQIDTVEASLVMHKALDAVWLPREIQFTGKVNTAGGGLAIEYLSSFYDYAKAETGATFRFPPRGPASDEKSKPKPKPKPKR